MAYATLADDVQPALPLEVLTIDSTSEPSDTTVGVWLTAESAWIDSTLAHRYVTPITNAADMARLTPICTDLVLARVFSMLGAFRANTDPAAAECRARALSSLAYSAKDGNAQINLPNTPLASGGGVLTGVPAGSFTDPAVLENIGRAFSVGMDF